ncbi:MAG: UvrD-helicase domain-containing protein [Fimbriimonadales bacterium]
MQWTPEQLQVIQHTRGLLAVSAGAGSGKTGVLTERFVELVRQHGVDPEQILTITFTRAATAEMKTRIIQKLEAHGLHDARQKIESAYIHTVHALCRRLLQENPFEAGIDPEMSVLPAPLSHQIKQEAFHEALRELLATLPQSERDDLTDLIAEHLSLGARGGDPLTDLFQMTRTLTESARHHGMLIEDLQDWYNQYPTDALTLVIEVLVQFAGMPQPAQPLSDGNQLIGYLNSLIQQATDAEQRENYQSLAGSVAQTNWDMESRAIRKARALLNLTATYLRHYESLKSQSGALDFDDMQVYALRLLRESATVRHRYQRLFKYVLVDETQDIDHLQAQIINLLAGGGNLMVVGDVQQSIYGFRYADPRVFQSWQSASQTNGRLVNLQANFRSHPDILAFVQLVFEHLWRQQFRTLTPMRMPQSSHSEPRVKIWHFQNNNPTAEACEIASQIHHWVETQSLLVHDPETGQERPARYGDFTLLFHQYTAVNAYEREFQRVGVPYFVVGGGRGYWLRYEVRDVANLVRALSDPTDDLALLSVLRSPFANLSLDALSLLALHAQQSELPLRMVLDNPPDLPDEDRIALEMFQGWFAGLQEQVGQRSVSWLLARALEHSAYESQIRTMENGDQQVANVRKLLALAIEQPHIQLQAFAEQLDAMVRTNQTEGNAPTREERTDVVHFYTVHSAKGLEFPVVFVVNTGFRPRRNDLPLRVEPESRLIGIQVQEAHSANIYTPHAYEFLKKHQDKREEEESYRKLYVALTRARDYLIVALTHPESNPWSTGLAGALRQVLNTRQNWFSLPNRGVGEYVPMD